MSGFEEKMERLENIVEKLEDREIPLNKSLELFEEGVKLVDDLQNLLEDAEGKVNELMDNLEVKDIDVDIETKQ